MEIQELLEQVKAGTLSIEEAKQYLRKEPFEELGYAKLDTHRKLRTGHAEVIYCEGKSTEHFLEIFTSPFLRTFIGKMVRYLEQGHRRNSI